MPHKNPTCVGSREEPHSPAKMEHHKWIEDTSKPKTYIRGVNIYTEPNIVLQQRILKCPVCDARGSDWKARRKTEAT